MRKKSTENEGIQKKIFLNPSKLPAEREGGGARNQGASDRRERGKNFSKRGNGREPVEKGRTSSGETVCRKGRMGEADRERLGKKSDRVCPEAFPAREKETPKGGGGGGGGPTGAKGEGEARRSRGKGGSTSTCPSGGKGLVGRTERAAAVRNRKGSRDPRRDRLFSRENVSF